MFDFYLPYEQTLARIQMVLFMVAMGLTLSVGEFLEVFRKPRSLTVGLAGQLMVAPLVAYLIVLIVGLEAGIATGLVLVASLPGGNLSKLFTYLSRGNIALSITMSATATLLCIGGIPLVLQLLVANLWPADLEWTVDSFIIINELLSFLIGPLLAGMVLTRFIPRQREFIAQWLVRAGLAIAVLMVTCSLGLKRINPAEYELEVPLSIIVFCVLTQQLSMLPFRLRGWPSPDCAAAGIETTMRNINLLLLLFPLLIPEEARRQESFGRGIFFVMLYYAGAAFFISIPLALRMRGVIRREQTRAAALAASGATGAPPQGATDR